MNIFENNNLRRIGATIFVVLNIFLLAACGEKPIASTDSESEANQMLDILQSKGLDAKKATLTGERKGFEISIDEGWFGGGEAIVATQVLNDYGLPRQKETLPESTNPYGMTSPEETKKRQNREKEIQIANHLYALAGVTTVSVIVAQPENDVFALQKTPPTASVVIVQKESPPKFTSEDVQKIVSTTVPELKPENVTVAITQQTPREIPLAQLEAQRRTNKIFAGGIALIVLLIGVLGIVWFKAKNRRQSVESNQAELPAYDEPEQLSAAEQQSLNAANDDVL